MKQIKVDHDVKAITVKDGPHRIAGTTTRCHCHAHCGACDGAVVINKVGRFVHVA
jgi:hypothetical protein